MPNTWRSKVTRAIHVRPFYLPRHRPLYGALHVTVCVSGHHKKNCLEDHERLLGGASKGPLSQQRKPQKATGKQRRWVSPAIGCLQSAPPPPPPRVKFVVTANSTHVLTKYFILKRSLILAKSKWILHRDKINKTGEIQRHKTWTFHNFCDNYHLFF